MLPDQRAIDRMRVAILMAVAALYLLLPLPLQGGYPLRVLNTLTFYTLFAMAFNTLFGKTNQLFLCIAALTGTGAYTTGLLSKGTGMNPWLTLPLGGLLASGLAAGLSHVAQVRRMGVIHMAVFTLAFQLVFDNLVVGLEEVTGGETGFRPPSLPLGPIEGLLGRGLTFYYLTALLVVAALLVTYQAFERRGLGLVLEACRQDPLVAESMGVDVRRVKVMVAAAIGYFLGFTGGLYGYYNGLIAPVYYNFTSIDILTQVMTVFGGRGTVLGPVLGAITFTYINELVRFLGPISLSVYGATLIALFLIFREGVIRQLKKHTRLLF